MRVAQTPVADKEIADGSREKNFYFGTHQNWR